MGGGMRADWLLEPGLLIRSCVSCACSAAALGSGLTGVSCTCATGALRSGLTGDKVGGSCACMLAAGGSFSRGGGGGGYQGVTRFFTT